LFAGARICARRRCAAQSTLLQGRDTPKASRPANPTAAARTRLGFVRALHQVVSRRFIIVVLPLHVLAPMSVVDRDDFAATGGHESAVLASRYTVSSRGDWTIDLLAIWIQAAPW